MATPSRTVAPSSRHGAAVKLPPHRVLLVDDNPDAADIAAMLLRQLGQDVVQVYDGASALDVAKEFCPDVIVLDVNMPGLNGLAVAKAIRSLPQPLRLCRIIAYTGYARAEHRAAAFAAGFDDFLVKPVSMEQWITMFTPPDDEA